MTAIIIIFVVVGTWFTYEIIKANHLAKHYSQLKPGQRIKYRDFTENGIIFVDAEVIWHNGAKVNIKTFDDGMLWVVDRKECFE